jgi:hypothetical protein
MSSWNKGRDGGRKREREKKGEGERLRGKVGGSRETGRGVKDSREEGIGRERPDQEKRRKAGGLQRSGLEEGEGRKQ